jgi:hypothetical protein
MSLTPEQFLERAAADKAMREQMKATNTEVTPDTLRGCAMALCQLAHALKMKREDVSGLVTEEWANWESYLATKQRIADKRKGSK